MEKEEENELIIENETKLIQFLSACHGIFSMFSYVPGPMYSLFLGSFQPLLKLIKNLHFQKLFERVW